MRDFPLIPATVERALVLYGCAYGGINDCRHVLAACVPDVTVVDIDNESINAMAPLYPPEWKFVCCDATRYVEAEILREAWEAGVVLTDAGRRGSRFDLIVSGPWGGNDMAEAQRQIPLMRALARDMVVVGAEMSQPLPSSAEQVTLSDTYCWWVFT